jgi:hypothetical protein
MSDYKVPIFVALIYMILLIFFSFVRTFTFITIIFLILHFIFHGIFVILGSRATKLHDKFVETNLATVSVLSMYGIASAIYFISISLIN